MEIQTALISALATLAVCLINNSFQRKKDEEARQVEREEIAARHDKSMAIIEYKIDELSKHVEKHNKVIERTYELEKRADIFDEKVCVANHRIADLEKKVE